MENIIAKYKKYEKMEDGVRELLVQMTISLNIKCHKNFDNLSFVTSYQHDYPDHLFLIYQPVDLSNDQLIVEHDIIKLDDHIYVTKWIKEFFKHKNINIYLVNGLFVKNEDEERFKTLWGETFK